MGCNSSTPEQQQNTSTPKSVKTVESNRPDSNDNDNRNVVGGTDIPVDAEQPVPENLKFNELYEVGPVVNI